MKFSHLDIIRNIMGEEASKRGFEIKTGKARLATKTLAIFHRKKSEVSQSFYITENLINKGVLYLDCIDRISESYRDERSFIECIEKFNGYLLEDGYRRLDLEISRPIFSLEDSNYVRDNYIELAKVFFNSEEIDFATVSIKNALDKVMNAFIECFDEEWSDIKDELLLLAGALTFLLVNSGYPIYIRDKKNMNSYYLEREKGLISLVSYSPLDIIYAAYRIKDVDKVLLPIVKKFFTDVELSDLEL